MTVSPVFRTLLLSSFAALGLAACSGSSTTPDGGSVTAPPSNATVSITSPVDGAQVGLNATKTVPVTFAVTNFTLKDPGTCAGAADCGQAVLLVDGHQCDSQGAAYNNISAGADVVAQLGTCPVAAGAHTFTVELHNDDGSVVVGPSGKYVSQTITVKAGTPPPSLSIVSPAAGSTVFAGTDADATVNVVFDAENLKLVSDPGMCGGDPACGILVINVDGDACDDPGAPVPVNNHSVTSPIAAKLALCPAVAGPHTFTLSVIDDSGQAPLLVNGQPLTAEVQATVSLPPTLTISSPADGSTVTLGGDANKTVSIGFSVTNVTLEPGPGSCAGVPACGILAVNIDGDACDDPNAPAPVNNFGATTTPIDAYFALCPTATGAHQVTLTVQSDDGSGPVMVNGAPITASVNITTQ